MATPAAVAQIGTQKKPEGLALYSRFAFAGAVCCSVTHGAFTPVDVYVAHSFSPTIQRSRLTDTPKVSKPGSSSTPSPTTVECWAVSVKSSKTRAPVLY
jgi:hypothetical protein